MLLGTFFNSFSGIIPIVIAILVFSILVVVHEFGHFVAAKKCGILVEEFSVGMGPILVSKQIGETLYSIRIFPIGGFCRMFGEDHDDEKNIKLKNRSFSSKTVMQRIIVIVAGPFMNFVLSIVLIFSVLSFSSVTTLEITSLLKGFNASEVGLKVGDTIKTIDGQSVRTFDELSYLLSESNGSDMDVVVLRDGQEYSYTIKPKINDEDKRWLLGIVPHTKTGLWTDSVEGYDKVSVGETVVQSYHKMIFYIESTISGFIRIFTFNVSPEEISGPIEIVHVIGDSYEAGIEVGAKYAYVRVAELAALLSANLGALNLFPIPAMDGGRLIFLILEGIRRKPISPEKEGMVHFAGFVILMAFMVFIAYNDINKIFF